MPDQPNNAQLVHQDLIKVLRDIRVYEKKKGDGSYVWIVTASDNGRKPFLRKFFDDPESANDFKGKLVNGE